MSGEWWRAEIGAAVERTRQRADVMSEQGYVAAAVTLRAVANDLAGVMRTEALLHQQSDGTL